MFPPFVNEPYTNFNDPAAMAAYQEALAQVRQKLGAHWPLVIAGEPVDTDRRLESRNPAQPTEIVGTVAAALRRALGR